MERIWRKPGVVYRAQAPNPRGAERAVAAKAQEILGLITASESYNLKNQNMTLAQGVDAAIATFRIADAAHTPFVMAVGMAMFCAYEGGIAEERVLEVVGRLHNGGIRRYYYAGSLGMEDPRHVNQLNEMNVTTGISTESAVASARDIARLLDIVPRSHVTSGGTRAQLMIDAKAHARTHPA